jgi:hypothetical protein
VPYNDTNASALRYATALPTLTANTKPSSTLAAELWTDAYNEVRGHVEGCNLSSSTYTASSAFETHLKAIEAQLTSGYTMLARESLSESLRLSADKLIARAQSSLKRMCDERSAWLTLGATATTTTSGYAASHFVDDADPEFDFSPGTGDRDYAADVVIQDTEEF